MPRPAVLLVTNDSTLVKNVTGVVEPIVPLRTEVIPSLEDAAVHLEREDVALLVPHLARKANTEEIGTLLRTIAVSKRPVPTLVVSDSDMAANALTLLRQGAADVLERPLDLHRLAYLVDVLTLRARYRSETSADAASATQVGGSALLLDETSPVMGRLMEQLRLVAPQSTTILFSGETGTGKTCLARHVHRLSPRRDKPFVVVNCGALPPTLMESELFGHVKGAFTGADRDRPGKFSEVGDGTVLLDEIDALPIELQVKLLRVLDERVFEPLGSNRLLPMTARLIVASNVNLENEVAAKRFRQDLLFRLNVVGFYLPPLRERRETILALADHFLRRFAQENGRAVSGVTPSAAYLLQQYAWPGNIRELSNVMERAVTFCTGTHIDVQDLPSTMVGTVRLDPPVDMDGQPNSSSLTRAKQDAEAECIRDALQRHKNNRRRTALELGISRMTLYKKMHMYGLIS